MGCVPSKNKVAPETRPEAAPSALPAAAIADPMDTFFSEVLREGYPFPRVQRRTMTLPPLLQALKDRITTNIQSEVERTRDTDRPMDYNTECAKSIAEFQRLLARRDRYHYFDIAAQVIVQSKKTWHLNDRSLDFFNRLNRSKSTCFTGLIDKFEVLCRTKGLSLQAEHIDTVIELLNKQMKLPTNLLKTLDSFLDTKKPDIKSIIKELRIDHGSKLTKAARLLVLSHHDVPHALEIRMRTMHIVCDKLHLMNTKSQRDRFLRTIVGFMIEFHDLVQKDKGTFKSVELATAKQIVDWLTTHPALADNPDIKKMIEFMADQIIVLGTTMVFSPTETVDLSQLSLMCEDAAKEAGFPGAHRSNQKLINDIKATMLITGVADKNPAAMPDVAIKQLGDATTATLPIIKSYFAGELQLERFFGGDTYTPYAERSARPTALDHQQFLITLVPHLCMRAELSVRDKAEDVDTYINFINVSRIKLATEGPTGDKFKTDFDERFTARDMSSVIGRLVFAVPAITAETNFSRSQTLGLEYVRRTLGKFIPAEADPSTIIATAVPETDALNFSALKTFYDALGEAEKGLLIKEMLLAVIFQAGRIYSDRPDLTYTVPPLPRFGGATDLLGPAAERLGPLSPLSASHRHRMFGGSGAGTSQHAVDSPHAGAGAPRVSTSVLMVP